MFEILFLICFFAILTIIPVYFLSLERQKLKQRYGESKGNRIGNLLGVISGWGFFLFWFGLLFSPQPRLSIPLLTEWIILVPYFKFPIPLMHLLIFLPLLMLSAWLGIAGVRETSLRVAETHKAEKIVSSGVYSYVRHPQYLAWLIAHIAIALLLSASYALLITPIIIILIYMISLKEEKELIRQFGKDYINYKQKVPMLIPKIKKKHKSLL
jgi:protein-S-isoprenylcysteine O-methyltransferase Ste14